MCLTIHFCYTVGLRTHANAYNKHLWSVAAAFIVSLHPYHRIRFDKSASPGIITIYIFIRTDGTAAGDW